MQTHADLFPTITGSRLQVASDVVKMCLLFKRYHCIKPTNIVLVLMKPMKDLTREAARGLRPRDQGQTGSGLI